MERRLLWLGRVREFGKLIGPVSGKKATTHRFHSLNHSHSSSNTYPCTGILYMILQWFKNFNCFTKVLQSYLSSKQTYYQNNIYFKYYLNFNIFKD